MDPQPQNQPPQNKPAGTTPQATPQPQTQAQAGAPAAKPAAALPKDQTKSNRKFVIGCVSAFGCALFLFLGVLFAFLAFGSTENPIFGFLGVPPGEVVNVLITLVNLIFLVLVFVSFIFVVIGVFKITTAKKEDREARRRGTVFTFASLAIMVFLIFVWIFAYFFLAQKRTVAPRVAIATEPLKTTGLTAPVKIKFDASKAPINKRQFDILSYRWNFGDGSEATGNPQTHTFTQLGNFKVTVTANLKEKGTAKEQDVQFTKDVTIANVLANVIIKADPKKGEAPLTVNLDGSDSSSENGEIIAYAWDLNGDGRYDDATDAKTKVTFDKVGSHTVGLRVTDSTGAFATSEIEIEVLPADTPVAVITVEGVEGTELEVNKAYLFSAARSLTPSGQIEKYQWEFGDSGKASTRTATHAFKIPGEYDVTLTIIDSNKKKGETTQRFILKAPSTPPLVGLKTTPDQVNGVVIGQAPFSVIFDASQSKDINDDIVEYSWDFDGDLKTDDANAVTSHTFSAPGTYNVSIIVTDASNLSTKSQIVVKVDPAALKAELGAVPIAGVVPLTVHFDASGSSDPQGNIVNFEWDFGEGGTPLFDTAKVSHQYTKIGTFRATVTVITSENKRASAQILINVRPVAVRACFEPSVTTGKAPLGVEFDPTCTTGTIVRYNWNFANLSKSTERKPTFTFKDPGQYTVTLEVADSQNIVNSFVRTITVESSTP